MTAEFPPGLILIVGAILVPLLRGWSRNIFMVALPIVSLALLLTLENGTYGQFTLFAYELAPVRVDKLSMVFGIVFHIAAIVCVIYAFHMQDAVQQVAALAYAGAAIGAVFAGDLITLFVFWELTAIASVFLIWASRNQRAYRAGMRYLIIQVGSGVLLLAGAIVHINETGSVLFENFGLSGTGPVLIFIAIGIKCAFPLLHNWLQDAYPQATITGTVFLSGFTTKLAVYALARGYPGTEMLIWIGALMAAFPVFYAVIEHDFRRVLAYSLNSQLGFMVCGVGIGTELAINGAAAHAFSHVLYKALLFMALGAVLFRTGTIKGSELGGLSKFMPWTAGFYLVGAASISAFPLFSGFISKSMTLSAAAYEGYWLVWGVLVFAAAAEFYLSGIKIPYFTFFARGSGIRCNEAPWNMLAAMGLTSVLCIGIGVWPEPLYAILPYDVKYAPYTVTHVITQVQLLAFTALAVGCLMRTGLFPLELKSTNLDTDWFYRRLFPGIWNSLIIGVGGKMWNGLLGPTPHRLERFIARLYRHHGPEGALARTWPTGSTALWVAVLLAGFLVIYYV